GEEIDPCRAVHPFGDDSRIGIRPRDEGFETANRSRPVQRIKIILNADHGRRVDRLALKDALNKLSALRHAEDLRHRPGRCVAFEPLHSAGAQDEYAMRRLTAENLLPGEGDNVELRPG